ncbi:MAG: glycosyltransferase family 2 protein [Promethearchaeota archaeon]
MKVSIIMSIYNGEDYLNKAIDSILNQTFKDFELILIDDASTDTSLEIIENYAKIDKRIRVLKNPVNVGLTKSLNNAIRHFRGKYIARQDVDDISLPNRLELQLNFLENNPEYAFCGTDVYVKQNYHQSVNFYEFNEIQKNLIINNCFAHSSILIRRTILDKYGLYNENYQYGQDYELWCRLIYKFKLKGKNLNKKLVIMNVPLNRLIEKDKKFIIQHKNYILTRLKHIKFIKNPITILRCIISMIRNGIDLFYTFYVNLIFLRFSKLR